MSNQPKFINKMIALSEQLLPDIKNKEKRIAKICGENESTVKNWLFHDRTPPAKKRMIIADKFGVSEEFLFGETDILSIPCALYKSDMDIWLIPRIKQSDIKKLEELCSLYVLERLPLKISKKINQQLVNPENTYCIEIEDIDFPPFLVKNDYVFINNTALKKEGIFCFYLRNHNMEIVRLTNWGDNKEMSTKTGKRINYERNSTIIPIILGAVVTR